MPAQTAPHQIQLLDYERVEKTTDEVAGRYSVTRPGLLQRTCTAYPLAPLQHQDSPAGPREVRSTGQPVVSCADDDDVPAPGGKLLQWKRQANQPKPGCSATGCGGHGHSTLLSQQRQLHRVHHDMEILEFIDQWYATLLQRIVHPRV